MVKTRNLISLTLLMMVSLAGCSASNSADASMEEAIASMEEKIPTRDRASVRICEVLYSGPPLGSYDDALTFVTDSLSELDGSEDPNGMKIALSQALIGLGDASVMADQSAGMNLATVCTDIVSGEYGK